MPIVDARGLSCPEPVLIVRKALLETGDNNLEVLVSTAVAKENVTKAATNLGWEVNPEPYEGGFRLFLSRQVNL